MTPMPPMPPMPPMSRRNQRVAAAFFRYILLDVSIDLTKERKGCRSPPAACFSAGKDEASLQRAFERAGIEIVGSPEDAPGVRLRRKPTPTER
jgi:hypothetical protein